MQFKDKVAIVTGGGRDIGRAVSLKLAAAGAKVCINYANDEASARQTLTLVEDAGGQAILHRANVTDAQAVAGLVAATREAFGDRIDILVNVAGGMVARKPLADIDETFFHQVMDLNLKSVFLTTQAVAPHMAEGAAIVNFSSLAGRDGGGGGASLYATAKGAVMTFSRAMAKELGPRGIRVNALCCGMIATRFHDDFTKPEIRQAVANATPLRREGRAEEAADVAVYLASDAASFINGASVDVNGGVFFS
ncbi:SDR family NAD(P)-dependent oxidoreductase [Pseudoxanthomonas wuyuanensis]|uniref:3-oxoacyl-[acyl-carrier protein] reductase n=1 Tax=Pseudoxanthomonas wuyuanensis TaxID=1073196 RepID=A0A286CX64_9GAMM|nr:glucose 1-dehydrogenase [Pseudoxanthomonas wuyuanensis]KAF1720844.1 3-oxoacyl-ACP reductase [Pseudoxanthomonas wuyuanensis]SOD51002.1 3-oxoacyl-[acyl-carrier protein] reductase [Pseudoxanthomonas wuyuanensis]